MSPQRSDGNGDEIASMDRKGLMRAILAIECDFPVDLTEEFLTTLSIDKLRHIYLALRMRAKEGGGNGPA